MTAFLPADAKKKPQKFTHNTVQLPAVTPRVIPVETANTQLILQVDAKGTVRILHYGAKAGNPQQFLDFRFGGQHNFEDPSAYPTVGGRFNGIDALHVEYADGTQNTELYFVSSDTRTGDDIVSTVLHLKDYVTALEADLVYDAYQAEDVILMHSVIRNGNKKAVTLRNFASAYSLAAGKEFGTPEMIYTWSGEGAGGASRNLHRWARRYGVWNGGQVNPTLLNSWEGAYFSFTTETLLRMIDDAAAMGLEMFVLDDGWFGLEHPRNSDRAGLGDWEVNTNKIPEGIDYVASYAHSKGLKFGIWIESEMVNPDSNLAREHPDWIVQSPGREIQESRNQWILDLSNPAVQDFVFGVLDRTVSLSPDIDYIKWDSNRRIMSFGSPYLGEEQDRFFVEYIQGYYNVCRRMREKYPDIVVQCCSAGGSRVDYGSLRWFNEFWTSDNTDAISRTRIQWGTSLIYPACAMASHVSAVPNHQTGNVTPLKFRFDVASSGRLGMELQPNSLTAEERALADRCIRSYKQYRDLVFSGDLYRLASPYNGDYYSLMYVSPDKRRAVVFCYCLRFQNHSIGSHVFRLQELDPGLGHTRDFVSC